VMPSDCEQSEWIIVQELKGEGKLRGRRSVKVRARIDRGGSFSIKTAGRLEASTDWNQAGQRSPEVLEMIGVRIWMEKRLSKSKDTRSISFLS